MESFDLIKHLHRAKEFSERTFGPGARSKGVVEHIRKELLEIEADPTDVEEWVDVIILAMDGAWRSGKTPEQIAAAIEAKQTKNEGRKWPDWRTTDQNKAIEHDRSGELAKASAPADSDTYWKHRKRGTTYREISRTGVLQASTPLVLRDGDILVTYGNEEGQLFHRCLEEFEDGRFVKVETAKPVAYGETVLSDLLVRTEDLGQ